MIDLKKEKLHQMMVDIMSFKEVLNKIQRWLRLPYHDRSGKNICLANVHMSMEVYDSVKFRNVINNSDIVLMDGKPLSVYMRFLGYSNAEQIRGEDITRKLFKLALENDYSLGFYGSTNENLLKLKKVILSEYENIKIDFLESPPFRKLSKQENQYYIDKINQNKIDILFVGLGCPIQELWMDINKNKINSVMLGVGAAFDFISGNKKKRTRNNEKVGFRMVL